MLRDLQYGFRAMRRRPGFAAVTILTLAVGIGATAAVFTIFDRALLRELPYSDSSRLVHVWETRTNQEFAQMEASYPNFQDWKSANKVFEDLAGYNGTNFTLTGAGAPSRVSVTRITTNMFSVLGIRPLLGRDFRPDEEAAGNAQVALITHGFWRRQFGGAPNVLGQTIRLGGISHEIVGVLPCEFRFALDGGSEIFVPLAATPNQLARRQFHWLRTIGRLKPAVDILKAEEEMKKIASQLASEYVDTSAGTSIRLIPLHEQIVGKLRPALVATFAAAACMLCLAFANLANLMIAQSVGRQREIGIRTALGADIARLSSQLIGECLAPAIVAGVVAVLIAKWTLQAMVATMPQFLLAGFPVVAETAIDARVIAFTFGLSLIAGVFAGIVVAYRSSTMSLYALIKSGDSSSRSNRTVRSIFTVAEIALAVMLLVGAVVMIRSVQHLLKVDPGFNAHRLVSMHVSLPAAQYPQPSDVTRFYDQLRREVISTPGVDRAAIVDEMPLTADGGTMRLFVQGRQQPKPGEEQESVVRAASPGYFETMSIRLIRGRTFNETDTPSVKPVMILNETLARKLFGDADPIGQRIVLTLNNTVLEIIGVVGDVHLAELDREIRPTFYTSTMQFPSRSSILVVRTAMDAGNIANAVRREVQRLDDELPVYAVRSMEETIALTSGVATRKLVLHLIGVFSSIGILMAGIGLYGLMNFLVAQRSKEIGIRIALGADRRSVTALVLNQAMTLTGIGLAIGVTLALAGTRFLETVLFGVTPSDPVILAIVAAIVAGIAYIASYAPIVRATRIDPLTVLRQD